MAPWHEGPHTRSGTHVRTNYYILVRTCFGAIAGAAPAASDKAASIAARAAIGLDSPGHAATGRNSAKTLVRDDRRSQDFTQGALSL